MDEFSETLKLLNPETLEWFISKYEGKTKTCNKEFYIPLGYASKIKAYKAIFRTKSILFVLKILFWGFVCLLPTNWHYKKC